MKNILLGIIVLTSISSYASLEVAENDSVFLVENKIIKEDLSFAHKISRYMHGRNEEQSVAIKSLNEYEVVRKDRSELQLQNQQGDIKEVDLEELDPFKVYKKVLRKSPVWYYKGLLSGRTYFKASQVGINLKDEDLAIFEDDKDQKVVGRLVVAVDNQGFCFGESLCIGDEFETKYGRKKLVAFIPKTQNRVEDEYIFETEKGLMSNYTLSQVERIIFNK
ncbi:hypothetical protein HBN50_17410 [Halobacteriovorax sp. GB3]|uniref:hypothetical protein n=1 Tax=Halobacteriovorax sp. GB3 TaxID=2719615 RepID=UPI00235FCE49|nr:hypothetical protein [Halobacteriovorax sp. GB3]MDD0854884.1 hypothetical protein [Halobacteriovorax sp. GB3]